MLYLGFGLLWPKQSILKRAIFAAVTVAGIECFQLTGISCTLAKQSSTSLNLIAYALGMHFEFARSVSLRPRPCRARSLAVSTTTLTERDLACRM